jgi:hypothetical protein
MNPINHNQADSAEALTQALAEPFDPREVRFKPAVVSGNRAMAIAYVDARVIQDRLDDVLGVAGWQDEYDCLPDGGVVCRLRLRLGDEWITKMDVGSPSEQPDEGDRRKASFSDALKRAAVKFGIGRYLYRLPSQWVDYDPQKRQFARTPKLPASALPRPRVAAAAAKSTLPADGSELRQRLQHYEEQLVKDGQCRPGELLHFIAEAGVAAGFASDLTTWEGPAIQLAVDKTKAFKERLPLRMEGRKEAGRSMPRLVTAGMVEAGKGIGA